MLSDGCRLKPTLTTTPTSSRRDIRRSALEFIPGRRGQDVRNYRTEWSTRVNAAFISRSPLQGLKELVQLLNIVLALATSGFQFLVSSGTCSLTGFHPRRLLSRKTNDVLSTDRPEVRIRTYGLVRRITFQESLGNWEVNRPSVSLALPFA